MSIEQQQEATSVVTFCQANTDAVTQWVETLPATNLEEISVRLYQAIKEMATTRLDPALAIEILEILRPSVYFTCQCLDRQLINGPITLSEKSRKAIELSQALQSGIAASYGAAARAIANNISNTADETDNESKAGLTTLAIHRAISDLTQTLLRSYKLYSSPATGTWRNLHDLYTLARKSRYRKGQQVLHY
jgi:hypothetical protein